MSNILQLVLVLLFDSYKPFFIAMRCLYILGAWMLLKKSGLPAFWSLVPWVREYQLGRSAGREPEGRSFCVTSMLITVLQLANICFRWNRDSRTLSAFVPLILVFLFSVMLMHFVFNIRVFAGFVQIYGVSRAWLILCIFDELRFLPMLIWGLSRKYQPAWKVENLKEEMERLAARGSAGILDEGLTVNLKDRHVKEFFHKKYLLKDIHMAIPQGHMVLLLGGSGAGKTTFLNAVNGYEKADAKVSLNGKDMYSDYKKMQYEVGFVPQQELVRGKDTVEKTLLDTARLRLSKDIPKEARRKRVEEVMEIFGLTPLKDSLVEKLSGGQKKRLSISMEILSNPSLFILARELFLELRRIADTGKIVIVITHTPDRVIDLFDDVIVLAKDSSRTGRLAFYGSVADAREFFGRQTMEQIVKSINQKEEGGDGLADEYVLKYAEVQNG